MKQKLISTTGLAALLLQGCTVGPDYETPALSTSTKWFTSGRAVAEITAEPVESAWWTLLGDPLLNRYVTQAAAGNLDIRIAESRLREARAIRGVEASAFYPGVNGSASVVTEGISENGRQAGAIDTERAVYDAGFDAVWELDIFGHTRRAVEAADARIEARIEARRDVLLSVLAEIARNYVELRGAQREMAILRKNIDLQATTLNTVRQRYAAGSADEFQVARAESRLRVTESRLPNLTATLRSHAYRIAVLLGREPQAVLDDVMRVEPVPTTPDIVPVGLRSDILRRRPDIREAERALAASTADIGVATTDLFPSFSLTGSAGLESLTFGDLFESTSTAWVLGPLIRWPVFQGGRIRAQIRTREAQAETAALIYERTVLSALGDAETALVRYGQELETRERFTRAADANRRAVKLAKQRYESGEDDILAVIDAERELADVERDLVVSETRSIVHLISLYKALGGGWEAFEPSLRASAE